MHPDKEGPAVRMNTCQAFCAHLAASVRIATKTPCFPCSQPRCIMCWADPNTCTISRPIVPLTARPPPQPNPPRSTTSIRMVNFRVQLALAPGQVSYYSYWYSRLLSLVPAEQASAQWLLGFITPQRQVRGPGRGVEGAGTGHILVCRAVRCALKGKRALLFVETVPQCRDGSWRLVAHNLPVSRLSRSAWLEAALSRPTLPVSDPSPLLPVPQVLSDEGAVTLLGLTGSFLAKINMTILSRVAVPGTPQLPVAFDPWRLDDPPVPHGAVVVAYTLGQVQDALQVGAREGGWVEVLTSGGCGTAMASHRTRISAPPPPPPLLPTGGVDRHARHRHDGQHEPRGLQLAGGEGGGKLGRKEGGGGRGLRCTEHPR